MVKRAGPITEITGKRAGPRDIMDGPDRQVPERWQVEDRQVHEKESWKHLT
jgi:hypothetical protein